jgi:hypothetical protein
MTYTPDYSSRRRAPPEKQLSPHTSRPERFLLLMLTSATRPWMSPPAEVSTPSDTALLQFALDPVNMPA